jgi:hypothetical protein
VHSGYWDAGLELFGDGKDDERLRGVTTSFADWASASTDTALDTTFADAFDGILCSYASRDVTTFPLTATLLRLPGMSSHSHSCASRDVTTFQLTATFLRLPGMSSTTRHHCRRHP